MPNYVTFDSQPTSPAPATPDNPRAASDTPALSFPTPDVDADVFQRCDRTARFPYDKREYARRFVWALVRNTLFRYSPNRFFNGWRIALLRVFGARIGSNCNVRAGCTVWYPWLLDLADWSTLADDVTVYNLGPVRIGQHTVISQGTYLCAGTHDYTQPDLPLRRTPIEIGSGVWIAAQAFIGPGATVGDNTVVGARAVVMGHVPPGVVVAGNPARVIKPREMKRDENVNAAPRSQ